MRRKTHRKSGLARRRILRVASLSVAVMVAALLPGCAATQQPENQAYALIMSIDKTDAGLLELGISLPLIGDGGGGAAAEAESEGGESSDDSSHENYFVIGSSFHEALDLMQAIVLRTLNLTQLKMIAVSQEAAQEPDFYQLVESLVLTNHLYTTPYVVVTLGSAKEFLKDQGPTPGKRFSSSIASAIEHYAKVGYITDQTLGTLYNLMNSIYGDPALMLASIDDPGISNMTLPPGELGNALPGTLPRDGIRQHEFMGAALFNHRQMVGVLTGAQTRWLAALIGQIRSFNYMCDGNFLELWLRETPSARIDLSGSPVKITVTLNVLATPVRDMPDKDALRNMITSELSELFAHCQSLGVDPFGYAELVAKQFLTVDAFEQYDWHTQFQSAEIGFVVNFIDSY